MTIPAIKNADTGTLAGSGMHILVDHYGSLYLTDVMHIEEALTRAAREAGATILSGKFHKFGGHGGVTGVLLLAESHISIHTWPENDYAAIDIFMCGTTQPDKAVAYLEKHLRPARVEITRVNRGLPEPVVPTV
ncbi:adenosylmethionine decarboxylase [Ruegeria faecimaris]|uniref:S-adenosylmethionine decarboxylase proenzyme n=1 Tax=Ruegeria faecimaris TaxID=686389 RepID=A0A521CTE0_9RHOB|nr:adenosylmethionine decarboxylase [Ruegeria faecimaris]SMO62675.1 S-adenosylmethionine decarboxylase [Ruegeria faecimaris]